MISGVVSQGCLRTYRSWSTSVVLRKKYLTFPEKKPRCLHPSLQKDMEPAQEEERSVRKGKRDCSALVWKRLALPLLFHLLSTSICTAAVVPDGENDGVRSEPSSAMLKHHQRGQRRVYLCLCAHARAEPGCRNPGRTQQAALPPKGEARARWSTALSWAGHVGLSSAGESKLVLTLSLCFPLHLPAWLGSI